VGRVDQTTDPEITAIGGGTSINLHDDVLFVADGRLYLSQGNDVFRVQCVNESELPSAPLPPQEPLISDRALDPGGRIAFRAETAEFVPRQFVVLATPISTPQVPAWPGWATWLGGATLGLAALSRARARARTAARSNCLAE
jgi:hypothetical protein